MFTALKKLTSKSTDVQNVLPQEMKMSGTLQKKFSKGVQYNMKIIIKGDRNVGKSCLLERLQGKGFIEAYKPTEEIQVASIQWSFKTTEDIVKVEVWDVVDRGKARPRTSGLKISTSIPTEVPALDAEFLDVYKGTHGVILMMDVTKTWTFEYVSRELSKIPNHIPVLILGNHCDMSHHRVITSGQVLGLIETIPNRASEIMYGESSMRNGFGLRLLHKFLGLPFLQLQKVTLTALLEKNKHDTDLCSFEVSEFLKSDDSDYNKFLDNLVNKRRQIADSNSNNLKLSSSLSSMQSYNHQSTNNSNITLDQEFKQKKSIIVGGGQPIIVPGQLNITNDHKLRSTEQISKSSNVTSGFVSSLLTLNKVEEASAEIKQPFPFESKVISVEEFCPDGGLDKSFLDDFPMSSPSGNRINKNTFNDDSDSDNEKFNPLVTSFIEDAGLPDIPDSSVVINKIDNNDKLKVNPLAKGRKSITEKIISYNEENKFDIRRLSISSNEIEINNKKQDKSNVSLFDDENNGVTSWLEDSNLRRSPEGGEDSIAADILTETKTSHEEKKKKKKSHKTQKEKKEKKSKRKSKETTDIENFLNGATVPVDDEEYEYI